MPNRYIVSNRQARPLMLWGLTLVPPNPGPQRPPVSLHGFNQAFAEAKMGEIVHATWHANGQLETRLEYDDNGHPYRTEATPMPPQARGLWTTNIFDCVVVCVAYIDPAHQAVSRVWFSHLRGGYDNTFTNSLVYDLNAEGEAPITYARYAVIACTTEVAGNSIAANLIEYGIPGTQISIYVSSTGADGFAFAFDFANLGRFGEITIAGDVLT